MEVSEEKRYEVLSPFELKNKLIELSQASHERLMLNAGRGNPNWVATVPREAFSQMTLFATSESLRTAIKPPMLGGMPEKQGISKRFEIYLKQHVDEPGVELLAKGYRHLTKEMKINGDDFILEITDAILGDHYPTPDRALVNGEKIIHEYLIQEMCAGKPFTSGKLDLFPTEGGTAAMDYVFNSLMENHLLHKGDKIALGSPIFTPYIEIPRLNDFEFVELEIVQDEESGWRYPQSELKKLEDPAVKAFFLVNPSNPTAVSMHPETLEAIGKLVQKKRKDLILLTDDVYGTFVNDFRSLVSVAPHNTILVYSYSKYFGATGWRLGVIGLHEDNVLDKKIAGLPDKVRDQLRKRYGTVELDPDNMKLIDRFVADSRLVALHHTAGLSTPQQVLIILFSLFCLVDKRNEYKAQAQAVVHHRFKTLYESIGIPTPEDKYHTYYYTTIDIPELATHRYEKAFSDYLISHFEPIDFVVRLAEEKSIVLMDGGGFDAPNMSVRVSLANLPDEAYAKIGKGINELLEEYYQYWKSKKGE